MPKNTTTFVDFCYKGSIYRFTVDPEMTISKEIGVKKVYFGRFLGEAPDVLQPGKMYCLKVINAKDPSKESCAALRECYELLDYKGDHLRQILLRNDNAEHFANALTHCKQLADCTDCMTIEPYYSSITKYFTDCYRLPVSTRLDIVRQCVQASVELRRNQVGNRFIIAHRDLKSENYVAQIQGDHIHIRLVDFATIFLNDTKTTGTRVPSGTMKMALSPENTSPESVMQNYAVSEQTDVYALGMLMASMFLRHKGKYMNPSEVWVKQIGWHNANTENLSKQMKRCLETYEACPDGVNSWIERDLRETHGITLTWETLPYPQVTQRIRELFCHATHIDPQKRPTCADFINELLSIIKLDKSIQELSDNERLPVCVYLFDSTNASEHMVGYQLSAAKAFIRDTMEAEQNGAPAPQALCISYGSPKEGEKMSDRLIPLCGFPCSAEQELCGSIENLRSTKPATLDFLLYGIHAAAHALKNIQERYYFNGQIYLFTPQLLPMDALAPFQAKLSTYDLHALCQATLDKLYGGQTLFHAFTVLEPSEEVVEQWECRLEYDLIRTAKDTQEDTAPEQPSGVAVSHGLKFDVSPNALYVKLPDGKQLYVGIIDD